MQLTEIDFQDSILTLGFDEGTRESLLEVYLQNRREIRTILSEMTMDLPHYHNLEWRFDVQVIHMYVSKISIMRNKRISNLKKWMEIRNLMQHGQIFVFLYSYSLGICSKFFDKSCFISTCRSLFKCVDHVNWFLLHVKGVLHLLSIFLVMVSLTSV